MMLGSGLGPERRTRCISLIPDGRCDLTFGTSTRSQSPKCAPNRAKVTASPRGLTARILYLQVFSGEYPVSRLPENRGVPGSSPGLAIREKPANAALLHGTKVPGVSAYAPRRCAKSQTTSQWPTARRGHEATRLRASGVPDPVRACHRQTPAENALLADDARSSRQRHHAARRTWMPAWARVTLGAPYHLGGMR
jgi:hypothetical protein